MIVDRVVTLSMDIGNIVSVIIGGVIVIAGQLLLSFFNSRTEKNKLQHEDIRNRSEAIGRFRERRVQPIIDALDRATRRWDADSYFELADMVGFEGHIVDTKSEDYEKERKKHILENMLFLAEYNKKNYFVVKQIFNINNEFKLNLYKGDSLQLDIQKEFGITKFDIIIGNPPYNEELTSVGAKPFYNKFIEYNINKCSLLSFIVPSRWFAGGKGLDKFRKMMINRTDILFIKHYKDACKIFGNSVSIEGGVNYFLIDKEYDGLCDYNGSLVKFNNFDIILDSKYHGIVNKFLDYDKITKYYISQDHYKIQTNDTRLIDNNKLIKCYVSQQKGIY